MRHSRDRVTSLLASEVAFRPGDQGIYALDTDRRVVTPRLALWLHTSDPRSTESVGTLLEKPELEPAVAMTCPVRATTHSC